MKVKIVELRKTLAEAAKRPPSEAIVTSARAAVEAARGEIDLLLQKGYSPREVAELLTASGVKISMASLSTYMRQKITAPEALNLAPIYDHQSIANMEETFNV